ncbi:MAG TPA: hypothetical protein VFG23_23385 [Polyangia bacterium]|nr:hypothetical protein [Polyangia bacterium]
MLRKAATPTVSAVSAVLAGWAVFASPAGSRPARAEAPWVYRSIVLPRGAVALDLGLGLGHEPEVAPDNGSITGFGLNLALSGSITHELEIGVRTGFRLDENGQATQADSYGRPFETETYGTNHDRVANPEVHLRWSVARGAAAELGLELRAYLPIENGSSFGLMFGLPIVLRAGAVRVDSGLYVPVIFSNPDTHTVVSVPVHIWIQATRTLWLGPLFGVRVSSGAGRPDQYPLGFGIGSSLTRALDLRTWILFPDISQNEAARTFGAGVALQIRFE